MDANDFLDRESFEALPDDEQIAYHQRVFEDMKQAEGVAAIDHLRHIYDIAEWTLSEEEVDRLLRRPLWDLGWENAERMEATLVQAIESGELTDEEIVDARQTLERAREVLQHKRDLENL
jgi:hypothetical protein